MINLGTCEFFFNFQSLKRSQADFAALCKVEVLFCLLVCLFLGGGGFRVEEKNNIRPKLIHLFSANKNIFSLIYVE